MLIFYMHLYDKYAGETLFPQMIIKWLKEIS